MRRQEHIAGIQQSRNAFMLDMARENHLALLALGANNPLNFLAQTARADQ